MPKNGHVLVEDGEGRETCLGETPHVAPQSVQCSLFGVQQEQRLRGIAETRIWTRCFLTSVPVVSLMRQSVLG